MNEMDGQQLRDFAHGLTTAQQQLIIEEFNHQVIFNELERRELERLQLIQKADEFAEMLRGISR